MKDLTKRQIEIIETSVELISQKGIQNLTIKNLSQKIGITEPAIYRHFKNKEDILSTLLMYFKQKMNDNFSFKEFLEQKTDKVFPVLERFFLKHIDIFLQSPFFSVILFSEEIFQNNKRIFEQIIDIMEEQEKIVLEIVSRAQQNKELRQDIPAESLKHILLGANRLIIKKWYFSSFSLDLKTEYERLWNSLKKMMTA